MSDNDHAPADAPSPGTSAIKDGIKSQYYTEEIHGPLKYFTIDAFELEEGGTLRECKIAYTTFGELNENKDNVVLFPHMYSGTSKDMEIYVGDNSAIDTTKYFVIMPNQIGNGLSTSPHNTPPPYGQSDFPRVRISDDVRAQHRLVTEEFGIEELQLVVGWSMGAQQTYEWAVRYPEMVKRAAPIGGTARNPDISRLLVDCLADAIKSDPNWDQGYYTNPGDVRRGLKRHARIWSLMGASDALYRKESWRNLGFSSVNDFMYAFWEDWFLAMDPNNLLCMMWKWQNADVSRITDGDLSEALSRIKAKMLVLPFAEDMFFTVDSCEREAELIKDSEFRPIPTPWGHFAMLGFDPSDKMFIEDAISDLLSKPV
jgi:homoserine O-acetyltransferase